jgi:hypothetical protein
LPLFEFDLGGDQQADGAIGRQACRDAIPCQKPQLLFKGPPNVRRSLPQGIDEDPHRLSRPGRGSLPVPDFLTEKGDRIIGGREGSEVRAFTGFGEAEASAVPHPIASLTLAKAPQIPPTRQF